MELWASYIDQILIFSIFAVSLNLLLGYAGQVSVAHASFGAVGGFSVGYLTLNQGWGTLEATAFGTASALLLGMLVALPALRLSVEYLILLTLAVSSVILGVFATFDELGGTFGLIGLPRASMLGWALDQPSDWLLPLLLFAGFTYFLCRRLGESAFGRVLRGIRDDDVATRSLGKNVFVYKVMVFGVASALAGLAGALLSAFNQLATPGQFGFDVSLAIFAMVIFGGMGNLFGSVLGAATVTLTAPFLERVVDLEPETAGLWRLAFYGLLLVVLMRLRPQGLLPEGVNLRRLLRIDRRAGVTGASSVAAVEVRAEADPAAPPPAVVRVGQEGRPASALDGLDEVAESVHEEAWRAAPVMLQVRGLSKRFGGIVAAEGIDMDLHRGTITALVGPNGAGKTTVFNLLTGAIRPDEGSVKLEGRELIGLGPDRVARLGMVRSFQDVRILPRLSCVQNVMLGVQRQAGENLTALFLQPGRANRVERDTRERAMEWLGFVGMASEADVPAGALSFGQSKLVALARVLATDAAVVLLDEPASGIDTAWVDTMLGLVEAVRDQGRTVCIVEHNLHVVGRLADHTYFMELGRIAAQGTISELTSSPRLAEAYFGTG